MYRRNKKTESATTTRTAEIKIVMPTAHASQRFPEIRERVA